jgi:hypothetical protein
MWTIGKVNQTSYLAMVFLLSPLPYYIFIGEENWRIDLEMLKSEFVDVLLNPTNISYYENLGYEIPRRRRNTRVSKTKLTVPRGTKILVDIKDLPLHSNAYVQYECDYCFKEKTIKYNTYNNQKEKSINKKDACPTCASKKVKETMQDKYGVDWNTQLPEVKDVISDKLKISEDNVNQDFENRGYIKLSKYKNVFNEIQYICLKHKDKGIQSTIYNNLKNAEHTCKYCIAENMSGENSSHWKGGITQLNNYLRSKIKPWQIDSYNNENFTCFITNIRDTKNIIVHHIKPFVEIVKEVLNTLNLDVRENISLYSEEELSNMSNLCLELHYKYGMGRLLISDLHMLFHNIYSRFNNTEEQLNEFKQRYIDFEFDNLLEDKYKYRNVSRKVS